jgi:hypothetical protein
MGDAKRLKHGAYAKASLNGIINDLGKWQRTFDPSWFFLARIAVPMIDQQLTGKKAAESHVVSTVVQLLQAHSIDRNGSTVSAPIFPQANYEISERNQIVLSSACTGRNLD